MVTDKDIVAARNGVPAEVYTEAAKGGQYDDKRLGAVACIVTKLAEKLIRLATRGAKRQPTAPTRADARQESAVSRHVRVNKGGSGRITVIRK